MTSARIRPWPELGAGPVASRSFPRTAGDAGEVLGTWGLMGGVGWVEGGGDGGLAGRKWANPDWPRVNNGAQPPPPKCTRSHTLALGRAIPAGPCVTAELSVRPPQL